MKNLKLIMATILITTTLTSCTTQGLHLSSSQPTSSNTSTSTEQLESKKEETLYGYTGTMEKQFIDYDTVYNVFEGFEELPTIQEKFYDNKDTIYCMDYICKGNEKKEISISGKTDIMGTGGLNVDYNLQDDFTSSPLEPNVLDKTLKELDFMSASEVEESALDMISKLGIEYDFICNVYTGKKGTVYDDVANITYDPKTGKPNPAPKVTVEEDFYYIEGVSCIDNIPATAGLYEHSDTKIVFDAVYTKEGLVHFYLGGLNKICDSKKVELSVTKEEALKKLGNYSISPSVASQTLPKKQLVSANLVVYAIYDEPNPEKHDYIGKRQFSTGWEFIFTDPHNEGEIDNDGVMIIDAITGYSYKGSYATKLVNPYDVYKKVEK